jgi:hypothetical protein
MIAMGSSDDPLALVLIVAPELLEVVVVPEPEPPLLEVTVPEVPVLVLPELLPDPLFVDPPEVEPFDWTPLLLLLAFPPSSTTTVPLRVPPCPQLATLATVASATHPICNRPEELEDFIGPDPSEARRTDRGMNYPAQMVSDVQGLSPTGTNGEPRSGPSTGARAAR